MGRRASLLAAFLFLPACLGDGSFDWYCDRLSSTPTTWSITARPQPLGACGSLPAQPFDLRFDAAGAQQPCGEGCTCTLSRWSYQKLVEPGGVFGSATVEECVSTLQCTFPGGTPTSAPLVVGRWDDLSQVFVEGDTDCVQFYGTPH